MNKRVASAGLAAGLLAGGAAGLALGVTNLSSAATQSTAAAAGTATSTTDGSSTTADESTATTTDDSSDTTADDATTDERPDRGQWLQDALQPLVDDGTITQAQADAVIAALHDARPEGGFGRGPGGHHGGPGFGHGRGFGRLEDAATALGLTEDELRAELQDGKTIAEIAAENGVELQTVVDAMLADLKAHLDEEVAEGDLTQEEADAKLAEVTERLTERLNQSKDAADAPGEDSTDTTTS